MAKNTDFNLQKFIITIVIIGVILVVGIYITSSIQTVAYADDTSVSVVNETNARLNSSNPYLVSGASALNFGAPVITAIYGVQGGLYNVTIPVANGTISSTGYLTNATIPAYANVSISYTYTYSATTDASDAAGDVTVALATGTSWLSILVIVGFATIILTMLTSGLGAAAGRKDEVPYY